MKKNSIISEWLEKNKKIGKESEKQCLHDTCSSCNGTGIKENGAPCIHFISCPCPKCSPTYF